ncbi:uncharacterized mitochondrial protein-like protein, partial [Tanacetum coccineum]
IGECFLDLQSWPCDLSCSTLLQILPLGLSVCALGLPRWHDDVDRSGSDSDCVQNPQGNLLYARTEYSNGNNDSSEGRGCGSYSRGRRRCRGQGRGRDNSQNQGQRDSSKNCEDNKQKGKQHEKRDLLHIQCYRCDHYGHFVSKCPERNRYHKVNLNKTQEKGVYHEEDKEANPHQVTIHNPVLETSQKSEEDKSGSDDMSIPIARLQTIRLLIALAAGRVRLVTIRLLITLAVGKGWKIHHLDVKTAFQNGNRKKLDGTLKDIGFLQCVHKKAVYRKVSNGEFIIIVVYEDDIFVTGASLDLINEFKRRMASQFEMSDLGELTYYLGIEVSQGKDRMEIKQERYAKRILKEVVCKIAMQLHIQWKRISSCQKLRMNQKLKLPNNEKWWVAYVASCTHIQIGLTQLVCTIGHVFYLVLYSLHGAHKQTTVMVEHVSGENQRVDPLTKALARIRFKEMRSLLGVQELPSSTQEFKG